MVDGQWVRWSGTYTPSPSDIGQPFVFNASFSLGGRTSLGFDGPVSAVSP
jgi:hypothetical protein